MQDCSDSSAFTMELMQSCAKPLAYGIMLPWLRLLGLQSWRPPYLLVKSWELLYDLEPLGEGAWFSKKIVAEVSLHHEQVLLTPVVMSSWSQGTRIVVPVMATRWRAPLSSKKLISNSFVVVQLFFGHKNETTTASLKHFFLWKKK